MWPAEVPQVSAEGGRGGTRSRVLVDAADRERVADVKASWAFGMNQAGLKVVVHRRQQGTVTEGENEVVRSRMGDRRWNPWVQPLGGQPEQRESLGDQLFLGSTAAGGW